MQGASSVPAKTDEISAPDTHPRSPGHTELGTGHLSPPPKQDTKRTSGSPQPSAWNWRTSKLGTESSIGMFSGLESFLDYDKSRSPRPNASPNSPEPQRLPKDRYIIEYFLDIENHLLNKTIAGDGHAYSKCAKTTRRELHAALEAERQKLNPGEATLEQRKEFEQRVHLFNAADVVFKFFFRPDSQIPTIRKFWGAVQALVQVRNSTSSLHGYQS